MDAEARCQDEWPDDWPLAAIRAIERREVIIEQQAEEIRNLTTRLAAFAPQAKVRSRRRTRISRGDE